MASSSLSRRRWIAAAVAGVLLAALGLSAPTRATARPAALDDGPGVTFRLERTVSAPLAEVRAMVTDFARYEERVPVVQRVEVLERDERSALVRFRYRIVRVGDFDLERRFVNRDDGGVDFETEQGSLGRLSGSWTLAADPQDPAHTRVRYEARLDPAFDAPDFVVRWVLKSEAPSLLGSFEALPPSA